MTSTLPIHAPEPVGPLTDEVADLVAEFALSLLAGLDQEQRPDGRRAEREVAA